MVRGDDCWSDRGTPTIGPGFAREGRERLISQWSWPWGARTRRSGRAGLAAALCTVGLLGDARHWEAESVKSCHLREGGVLGERTRRRLEARPVQWREPGHG